MSVEPVQKYNYKIELKGIYKVFGPHPERGLQALRSGTKKEDVREKTGQIVGLSNINLAVKDAEMMMIMGLSGSGKSTLVRHINRLIEPTDGQVLVDGDDILGYDRPQLREFRCHKVSMVFQRFGLFPHKTIIENVSYGLSIQGRTRGEREDTATTWLKRVGLTGYEHAYPRQLSGGMQQRVGLARALATNPEILLLDEPFSALDPLIRRDMQKILTDLQTELKKTIVFITHDLEEALSLGDRIAMLRGGEIVQTGTPKEIIESPQTEYVEKFVKSVREKIVLN